jgi:hypothetical protein
VSEIDILSASNANMVHMAGRMRRHRKLASQNAFDRRDLISENFQLPQLPFYDKDFHTALVIEMDMN